MKKIRLTVLLPLLIWGLLSGSAYAAKTDNTGQNPTQNTSGDSSQTAVKNSAQTNPTQAANAASSQQSGKAGKWKAKNKYYYYKVGGKSVKGLYKIGKKTYYFDSTGKQRTGWRQINGVYRFFRIENGVKGSMVTRKTVNGVKLDRTGAAVVTPEIAKKLKLMTEYQELVDQLAKPGVSKEKKLVICFKYARKKPYRSLGAGNADLSGAWDERFADTFLHGEFGECIALACGFAYMANAVGYTDVLVRHFGNDQHCHCEIADLVYDPTFARHVSENGYRKYFGIERSKSLNLDASLVRII